MFNVFKILAMFLVGVPAAVAVGTLSALGFAALVGFVLVLVGLVVIGTVKN